MLSICHCLSTSKNQMLSLEKVKNGKSLKGGSKEAGNCVGGSWMNMTSDRIRAIRESEGVERGGVIIMVEFIKN